MGNLTSIASTLGILAALGAACSPSKVGKDHSTVKIVDESLTSLDLLSEGPYSSSEYEYDSGAFYDTDVLPSTGFSRVRTDIRGRIYVPAGSGPFPLVIFLHGNHATCGIVTGEGNPRLDIGVQFTTSGACPAGQIEAPSYRGYDDSARLLASHGYIVASINANRGITGRNGDSTDGGLIYARGNLVLRHIEELYKWSRDGRNPTIDPQGSVNLRGKIDISKVGMMGHSRGGEGIRYAYNTYKNGQTAQKWQSRIPGLKFGGLFEIGPVDMGTNNGKNKVEASGVAWNVLIPGCDSDVLDFSGVNPYERMLANINDGFPKSVFTVWGANHNFFNTEWQVSDAPHSCIGDQEPLWDTSTDPLSSTWSVYDANAREGVTGSTQQIEISKGLMLAFFDAYLGEGKTKKWDHVFDPQYRLPRQLSALADTSREYFIASDSKSVFNAESFVSGSSTSAGLSVSTLKNHVANNITSQTEALRPFGYRAALYSGAMIRNAAVIEGAGSETGKSVILPLDRVTSGEGFWTIDIGLATRKPCFKLNSNLEPTCAPQELDKNFQVALVLEDGSVTKSVRVDEYVALDNWYSDYFTAIGNQGSTIYYAYIPVLYQTSRFELTDFDVTNERIKGVQLTFDSGKPISLIVDSMRLTKAE